MLLHVSRDTFDLSQPLRAWLFTMGTGKAGDALRRSRRVDSTNLGSRFDSEEHSSHESQERDDRLSSDRARGAGESFRDPHASADFARIDSRNPLC